MAAVADLTTTYIQTGVLGTFFLVGMGLLIWYFTKGRKQMQDERERAIQEQASTKEVIRNNTAVIENCTEVIRASTQQRGEETRRISEVCDRITRQGEQLDELLRNQAVCMELQKRK
jgi:uncharacterized protein HemX